MSSAQIPFTVFVDTDELLRKKWKGLPAAENAFRTQAQQQFRGQPLKGDVSVSMALYAGGAQQPPQLPSVVKAYLDALEGIAYENDRQVAHLSVRRNALDHPLLTDAEPDESEKAGAFIEVVPVSAYRDLFDRAFHRTFLRRGSKNSPWRRRLTVKDHSEISTLDWRDKGRIPPPLSAGEREVLRLRRQAKLLDGQLADHDRPGPLPTGSRIVHKALKLDRLHYALRKQWGSVFLLPLRGQQPGSSQAWREAVLESLAAFRDKHSCLPLDTFVALDVAVRGDSLNGKDLDNLVHGFLVPFEELLCAQRGTVVAYRVYRAEGYPHGVQVRVVDSGRLLELEAVMHETAAIPTLEERLQRWLDDLESGQH